MLSKKFVEAIVSLAKREDIETFAVLAVEHLKKAYPYNDNVVDNALQIITGVTKPYTIDNIDLAKLEAKVRKLGYNTKNAGSIRVIDVDSINLEVTIVYKNPDDKYDNTYSIDIADVLKEK